MRFDVGFIDDIKAVTVAEFVEIGVIGVVRRAYGVDVEPFHKADVLLHRFARNGFAAILVVVVPVHAAELYRYAVDEHFAAAQADVAESDLAAAGFGEFSGGVAESQHQRVECGILGAPLFGCGDTLFQQGEIDVVALGIGFRKNLFDG